jgi:hypothetical protein
VRNYLLRNSKRRGSGVRDLKVVKNEWIRGESESEKQEDVEEKEAESSRGSH